MSDIWAPELAKRPIQIVNEGMDSADIYYRAVAGSMEYPSGKAHIYVTVLDENGESIPAQIEFFWPDGHEIVDAKYEDGRWTANFPMHAGGRAYGLRIYGVQSTILHGFGLGPTASPISGEHVTFYLVYRRQRKSSPPGPPPDAEQLLIQAYAAAGTAMDTLEEVFGTLQTLRQDLAIYLGDKVHGR